MSKTASQKVAFGLEILGYILLAPASLLVLSSLFILPFFLITVLIYCFGLLLLVGYHNHQRGRISRQAALLLWIGTTLFNGVPLVWLLYLISQTKLISDNDATGLIFLYNIIAAYFIIVYYSIYAFRVDFRRDFNVPPDSNNSLTALNLSQRNGNVP